MTKKRPRKAKTVTTLRHRLRLDGTRWFVFGAILGVAALYVPQFLRAAPQPQPQPEKDKPYALIFGTVWGPDDHPVYGVKVKIRRASDKANKVRWELYSDHMGEFAQRVPAGEQDYIISADLKGFKMADGTPLRLEKEVTVHIYNDERQDTGLHLTH
jgi:hypothetical protein